MTLKNTRFQGLFENLLPFDFIGKQLIEEQFKPWLNSMAKCFLQSILIVKISGKTTPK